VADWLALISEITKSPHVRAVAISPQSGQHTLDELGKVKHQAGVGTIPGFHKRKSGAKKSSFPISAPPEIQSLLQQIPGAG
jgi:hypothetical protein